MRWRDDCDLPTRFERVLPRLVTQAVVAAVLVAVVTGLRILIGRMVDGVVEFALVFPAVVGATLLAGAWSGLMVIVAGQLLAWYFFLPDTYSFVFATPGNAVSLVLATAGQGLLLWSVSRFRDSLRDAAVLERSRAEELQTMLAAKNEQARIAEQLRLQDEALHSYDQNLTAIYEASADGLTLCRAIKDAEGQVIEYQVLEVNKSHEKLTGVCRNRMLASVVSSIAPPVDPRWFTSADKAVKTGVMQQFDVYSRHTKRWLNIRVSRVSDNLFQQTFVDVTDRRLLEEQREQMLKEMSHRVANNLQMVASFLHVQSRAAEPGARHDLQTAEGRVHVLAKLHSLLAYAERDSEVDAAAYMRELCGHLRSVIDRTEDIGLTCECEPLRLDASKIVPLGFIVSELVTNAAKYAFPPPRKGQISVILRAGEEERWKLTVADDGQGMAATPNEGSRTRTGSGLGTRLVRTFVEQIGGDITTTSERGTRHEITFKP